MIPKTLKQNFPLDKHYALGKRVINGKTNKINQTLFVEPHRSCPNILAKNYTIFKFFINQLPKKPATVKRHILQGAF
jgi:hypothetical protein